MSGNKEPLQYQSGFGNYFATQAVPGTLPEKQNNPQQAPRGLYAEQLSGSSFLAPRHENQRTWLYRIIPAVSHGSFKPFEAGRVRGTPFDEIGPTPAQLRWDALPIPKSPMDFLEGLTTMAGSGNAAEQRGCAVHLYACTESMTDTYFYSADGDFLFVPETGSITLKTELGWLEVGPKEIAVIPRGIRFQVDVEGPARGYVCENFGPAFRLPHLGPIGSNGLASPRDFQTPIARFEQKAGKFRLIAKFNGKLWRASISHSPLDVVAWHGNYAPYKYDLTRFNTINTVSFDHPDPSIFTVLTSPSELNGVSNIDFVIFPPRWMVAEHTFRPPYYHRNVMSEWMGLVHGVYDAKSSGFVPGGSSLHNSMTGHGPDAETFEKASQAELKPQYLSDTLAFMFESRYPFAPTAYAMESGMLQQDYHDCWKALKSHFHP
jgi:homogentisate 1,2-dioxygenase